MHDAVVCGQPQRRTGLGTARAQHQRPPFATVRLIVFFSFFFFSSSCLVLVLFSFRHLLPPSSQRQRSSWTWRQPTQQPAARNGARTRAPLGPGRSLFLGRHAAVAAASDDADPLRQQLDVDAFADGRDVDHDFGHDTAHGSVGVFGFFNFSIVWRLLSDDVGRRHHVHVFRLFTSRQFNSSTQQSSPAPTAR